MNVEGTRLEGVKKLTPVVRPDDRGFFVKTFHKTSFAEAGIHTDFPEHFFSKSRKNVVRGMHFQTPPHAQAKVVFCVTGSVRDVVLDLRKGSPTYGEHIAEVLSSEDWGALYLPPGFAHGFVALEDDTTMAYLVGAEYAPSNDTGVRWDSFGCDWGLDNPIVSDRDKELTPLSDYDSPFSA